MRNGMQLSSFAAQQGIVLLEALIAILIFSVGILGVVGLQAAMIKSNSEAKYRAEANFLIQQRLGAMWVDQANLAMYAEDSTDISAASGLPNGRRTTVRGDPGAPCNGDLFCFMLTVSWQQPGSDMHSVTTVARVTGGL